jgi:PAS domain S-box-containing protein
MRREQHLFQVWREHHLFDTIDQVVFELDESARWTFLNATWTELSGYGVPDTIGRCLTDALHPDDVAKAEELLQQVKSGTQSQATMRLRTRSGRTRWVNLDLRPRPGSEGTGRALVGSLSDASAQKEVEERLQQQIRELLAHRDKQVSFSTRVAREFASGKPLNELYDWFVRSLNEAFGYYHTQLFHYDGTGESATLVAAAGKAAQDPIDSRQRVQLGVGLLGKAVASGEPVLQHGDGEAVGWEERSLLPGVKAGLAVPILLGDEVLGLLVVYAGGADELGAEDTLLLAGLAGQLATAIDSMQLRQEMEERMAELDNLQRLMRREAWLRARDTYSRGVSGYRFDRGLLQAVEVGDGADAGEHGELEHDETTKAGAKKSLASLLQVRGQTIGVIGVEDDPDNPLSPADEQLLEAISQQVSEAMENARLLEQTQKRAVELETVARVSTATSTILEKDKLLQGVVELTKRSFNLYHAHIYLLNAESGELVLAAGSGDAGQQMVQQGWRIDLDQPRSIVAHAARARKGIIVNDVRKETGFLPNALLPATRSELAVPMISGNRLLGVLDVQSDVVNYFTQDDVRIQSALAGQVATALQNATLYQEQLETAEKLREFDRLKSEFLASMSHELRTPLNSIIGFADVLLEGIDGELNERMREDVQLIRNSGQHLRELIGDILDMSKIEAGMMDLRYETFDPSELRHEIEGFARTQLLTYDKVLEFKMNVSEEVGIIEADVTRFKQVLFNLVSNAIKFTRQGSVTLSLSIEDEALLVRVADTGIDEDDVPIIFEQFRQVDGSLTRTAGGTGLGLPITKSLVELHGGEIWVESEVGAGTTFCFTIPVQARRAHHGRLKDQVVGTADHR